MMRSTQTRSMPASLLMAVFAAAVCSARPGAAAGQEIAVVLEGHGDIVRCVAFSPDSKTVATGSDDGTIRLWDVAAGKEKARFDAAPAGAAGPVRTYAVAFAAGGKLLLASVLWDDGMPNRNIGVHGTAGGVRAWDIESKKLLYTLPATWMPRMAVAPDGKTVATGSDFDHRIAPDIDLWEAETGKKIGALTKRVGYPKALYFSPDGKRLAVGTDKGAIELWDWATQKPLAAFRIGGVIDFAFAPDGKTLAVGTGESLKFLEIENLDAIRLRDGSTWGCNEGGWGCLKYTPDGKELATGYGHVVRLLSTWSAEYEYRKAGWQYEKITCMAFSPDGKLLALAGQDKVRIWSKFGEE